MTPGTNLTKAFTLLLKRRNGSLTPGRVAALEASIMKKILTVFAVAALSLVATQRASAVPVNVALGRPTSGQTAFSRPPSLAVDGSTVTISHTNNVGAVFWQVDLGSEMTLDSIELVSRQDGCCPERMNGAVLSVLDSSLTPIFTAPTIAGAAPRAIFTYDNGGAGFAGAQHIRVDQNNQYLSIAELRAFVDMQPNLANLFGTASQSTTAFSSPASNAIDGNIGSFTHTAVDDLTPSLEVDLNDLYRMEEINLFTRADCCTPGDPERDYNLLIEVLDDSGQVVFTNPLINPWDGVDPPGGAPDIGNGASFSVDLSSEPGGGVIGQTVRVSKVSHAGNNSQWLAIGELEIRGSTTPVPEPATVGMLALGLLGMAGCRRRRR